MGVSLTQEDLEAIKRLYADRWYAEIKNWQERDTDYCIWFVTCHNSKGSLITKTGHSLASVIDKVLAKVRE